MTDPHSFELETTEHVALARDGDRRSLAWLIDHLTPALRLQARHRLTGSPLKDLEPDDLVHEAWCVALPRLGDLRERDGRVTPVLVRFLATTLLRRYQSHLKSRLRRNLKLADCPAEQVEAELSGAVSRMVRAEQGAEIEAALDALGESERTLIVRRGLEGQSWAALAEQLGEPEGTLSSRYSRALTRLRERLQDTPIFEHLD